MNKEEKRELEELKRVKNKERWYELLLKGEANCYIKPNRYIHDSGFRCFEVGYLIIDDNKKIREKLVLNKYSDHIQLYDYFSGDIKCNLDLMLDGYIRVFPIMGKHQFWWGQMDYVVSSAQIQIIKEERKLS